MSTKPFLITCLLLVTGCASTQVLTSTWVETGIEVDGLAKEWGELTVAKGLEGTSYGLRNDGDALYVCFLTNDQDAQRQIIVRGLVLWIDPKGGQEQYWGLRFPLGLSRSDAPLEEWDATQMREASMSALEVIGPGSMDRLRIPNNQMTKVQARVEMTPAGMIYEARVPLALGERPPYGPGIALGAIIGVGFVTPQMDMEGEDPGPGSDPGAGGRPGLGGRGGRGGGERPGGPGGPGGRGMRGEELDVWTQVALEGPPQSQ